MMKVTLGEKGLKDSYQAPFPKTTKCAYCKGEARIGFVAIEDEKAVYPRDFIQFVVDLHDNEGEGGYWYHDLCATAVYFCRECLEPTALSNQG